MKKSENINRKPKVIKAGEQDPVELGGFGIHWKIDGSETDDHFSIVHHPMAPKTLAAPLHYHHREDEYSYIIKGKMGALLGDDVVVAEAGSWVHKPAKQWHTFWNAGDTTCEIIEVISPAGFENFFKEIAEVWDGDDEDAAHLMDKYDLEMDFESVPGLCEQFGLNYP